MIAIIAETPIAGGVTICHFTRARAGLFKRSHFRESLKPQRNETPVFGKCFQCIYSHEGLSSYPKIIHKVP